MSAGRRAREEPRDTDLFRLVHAGHDIIEVGVVIGNAANPPLICLTCHEEQNGYE